MRADRFASQNTSMIGPSGKEIFTGLGVPMDEIARSTSCACVLDRVRTLRVQRCLS